MHRYSRWTPLVARPPVGNRQKNINTGDKAQQVLLLKPVQGGRAFDDILYQHRRCTPIYGRLWLLRYEGSAGQTPVQWMSSDYPGSCRGEARRKPRLLLRFVGPLLLRLAARQFCGSLFQLPPRFTRLSPLRYLTTAPKVQFSGNFSCVHDQEMQSVAGPDADTPIQSTARCHIFPPPCVSF